MQPLRRRDFVALAAASATSIAFARRAAAGAQAAPASASQASAVKKADRPLKILVLGGTAFIGPEFVEHATARGHTLTLFNRGKTRPGLFPNLEKLRGDRDPKKGEGLKSIEAEIAKGREWDIVLDNCGYYPRHVKASAELLAPKVKKYIFVSSISAFKEGAPPNSDEGYPVATLEDPNVEDMGGGRFYGGLKALCEQAAEAAMPGRVANVRPGFIVGPGDFTGRFSYWPLRARQGGEMLGPGTPNDPVQWIDVRDLAEWLVAVAEQGMTGVYIATGPKKPGTIGEVIESSVRVAKATAAKPESVDTKVTWVPTEFLVSQQVGIGSDLPIWIPPEGEYAGFHQWNVSKAVAAGLTFRPVDETMRGIFHWHDTITEEDKKFLRPAGMSLDREKAVLAAWSEKLKSGAPATSPTSPAPTGS